MGKKVTPNTNNSGIIYAPYMPAFITTTNISDKEFHFNKQKFYLMKSHLKLAKQIVLDNSCIVAVLNIHHDDIEIRKLCDVKIQHKNVCKYWYKKRSQRKLNTKWTLDPMQPIQIQHCGSSIEDQFYKLLTIETNKK